MLRTKARKRLHEHKDEAAKPAGHKVGTCANESSHDAGGLELMIDTADGVADPPAISACAVFLSLIVPPLDSFPLFWKRRHFGYLSDTDGRVDSADFLGTGFAFRLVLIFI